MGGFFSPGDSLRLSDYAQPWGADPAYACARRA